ncbi:hypothetical protein UY3_07679 [Chelonia mydas]|uniref:Uncharacterized protein n=1 Tax=Chelonia mydas TaxID=8469 RepID=M7BST3_CHEMY|nr:hypothetical protein UY3_07679 [Chelonia mydas]
MEPQQQKSQTGHSFREFLFIACDLSVTFTKNNQDKTLALLINLANYVGFHVGASTNITNGSFPGASCAQQTARLNGNYWSCELTGKQGFQWVCVFQGIFSEFNTDELFQIDGSGARDPRPDPLLVSIRVIPLTSIELL